MTADPEHLAIGRIVKPFGVHGELVVEPLTDDPERFTELRTVLLGPDADTLRPVSVERVRVTGRGVRLRLEGTRDRDAAEALRGLFVFVSAADCIRLPPGRHFVHTLIGLSVVSEEGERLGILTEVLKLPAHDVYVIRGEHGEMMIPAVEEFVRRIDPSAGTVTVRLIEGMSAE